MTEDTRKKLGALAGVIIAGDSQWLVHPQEVQTRVDEVLADEPPARQGDIYVPLEEVVRLVKDVTAVRPWGVASIRRPDAPSDPIVGDIWIRQVDGVVMDVFRWQPEGGKFKWVAV